MTEPFEVFGNEDKEYIPGEGLIPYIRRITGANNGSIHGKCRACNGSGKTRCINTPEGNIAKMKKNPDLPPFLQEGFIHPKTMNPFRAFGYICEMSPSDEEQTCPICFGEGFEHT